VLLSELESKTLDVARGNAQRLFPNDSTISFVQSNLLDTPEVKAFLSQADRGATTETPIDEGDQGLILVANLPYIPEELFDNNVDEGVKKWEPKMAFVGGDDGLDLYRIMFDQLLAH